MLDDCECGGSSSSPQSEDSACSTVLQQVTNLALFRALQHADDSTRDAELANLMTTITPLAQTVLSQHSTSASASASPQCVTIIARLADECPFPKIRAAFGELLETLISANSPPKSSLNGYSFTDIPPVSRFFHANEIPSVPSLQEMYPELQPWLEDVFLITGRVSHLERILCMLPQFYPTFATTLNQIMRADGHLPVHYRNYLAILASSRYKCQYLISLYRVEFLQSGGDLTWLNGLEFAPKKIQSLLHFNACLAHQPWRINSEMIQELVEGSDSWSIAELMHATIILSTFHMLSALVIGLGITAEMDLRDSFENEAESYVDCDLLTQKTNDEATQNMIQVLSSNVESLHPDGSPATSKILEEELAGAASGLVENESDNNLNSSSTSLSSISKGISPKRANRLSISWSLLKVPPEMDYDDFFRKKDKKEFKVFRIQDYNWKNHGMSLLTRYYPDAARVLDDEFDFIYEMTDNYMNRERGVDTGPFRRAIWNYAMFVYGVVSDSYNYQKVNVLLNQQIKSFIKKLACHPASVNLKDFQNMGYNLQPEEKVHVSLLALEGRRRACMLYALHAIMKQRKY
jgi:sestrin